MKSLCFSSTQNEDLSILHSCRPLPILTVDEFILLHKVIQAATSVNPQAVELLRNVRNAIGRNILGNLLDLGQVAFAPATPDVLNFADHMVKNHGTPSTHLLSLNLHTTSISVTVGHLRTQ